MGFDIKSAGLTDFDGCSFRPFSSRTAAEHPHGKEPSTVLAETFAPKGLAMLIRSKMYGVGDGAACAVRLEAIPAASLPTLPVGGLLLLIGP